MAMTEVEEEGRDGGRVREAHGEEGTFGAVV